MSLLYTCW